MSSKVSGVLALIGKWLLVPAVFGLVGYYIVGPRLGLTEVAKSTPQFHQPADGSESETPKFSGEPEVNVEVQKPVKRSTFTRKKKKKPEPSLEPANTPPLAEPPPEHDNP